MEYLLNQSSIPLVYEVDTTLTEVEEDNEVEESMDEGVEEVDNLFSLPVSESTILMAVGTATDDVNIPTGLCFTKSKAAMSQADPEA